MILIVADHHNGSLRKASYELVSAARAISDVSTEIAGLVIGGDAAHTAQASQELATLVAQVYSVSDSELKDFRAETWTRVVSQLAKEKSAQAVLIAASRSGLSYSPRVALRLDAPLLEDVTGLEVQGGKVCATRLSYLARVTETVQAQSLPVVVSVKPNVFPVAEAAGSGEVHSLELNLEPQDLRVKVGEKSTASSGRVALEEADVVVAGGRGVGSPEGFSSLVEGLADKLSAGVGATRAVVDAGWRPYAEQIGQTGKTVAPTLYVALGVSGAVQHLSGMNRSKCIIAVNKDPDAPIFKVADYGIVGDVHSVVPALGEALEAVQGS